MASSLYPLLFRENRKTLVWGTEDWDVSAVPQSESVVRNGAWAGMLLTEVIGRQPVEVLGAGVADRYHNQLPLLAKVIDARQDLSIQVHPDDEMAMREHGKMGKSEMWYILDAKPGAALYAGFREYITPSEYRQRVADGTITEVLARHAVQPGDVFYLPSGRVHAICGGIRLAEVQQSSDVTYRIFDYNRPGLDGKPRQLHTELAAQAIDYRVERDYRTTYPQPDNRAVLVVDTPFFSVRVLEFTDRFHRNLLKYDSFIITMSIQGDCTLRVRSTGDQILLREGHSALIPAAVADYDLIPVSGRSRILDAFIDNRPATLTRQITQLLHVER